MKVSPNIFRKYDIRGIYPSEINEDVAEHVGKAFGTYLVSRGFKNCLIGRDNRHSSPSMSASVVKGLLSTGVNVTDAGIMLTPVIIYGTCDLSYDCAVVVTASHNPKEFSGIKLYTRNATPYAGDELQTLIKEIENENYVAGSGELKSDHSLLNSYIEFLKPKFNFKNGLNVVAECGGGPASLVLPKVFEALSVKAEFLHKELNSDFPPGTPDPENPHFMENLVNMTKSTKSDIGVALDTDGDRMGVVGNSGKSYKTDEILMLLAEEMLKKYPGSEIIYDVKSSEVLDSFIKNLGGRPKMMKTGRSNFEDEMKNGAVLGAEFSGHVYYAKDYFGYDDGIFTILKLLQILTDKGVSLDELMSHYPQRVSTHEIKVPIKDELKDEAITKIMNFVKSQSKYTKVITLDGIRAYISDTGWFLIRSSGTSPYLSARMEALDEKEMSLVKESFEEALQNIS